MNFRWMSLVVLVGCLGTSAYFRHRARQQSQNIPRSAEGALFMAVRGLVAVPLFLGPVAYVVSPASMAWASIDLPSPFRWMGVVFGALTIPAARWVFRSLGRNVSETVLTKTHHELVSTGPYRWVRHPLYLTGIALFLSIGLMAANWFILTFAALAAVLIRIAVIPVEEQELVRKFGDGYLRYSDGTGRLLPRVRVPHS